MVMEGEQSLGIDMIRTHTQIFNIGYQLSSNAVMNEGHQVLLGVGLNMKV